MIYTKNPSFNKVVICNTHLFFLEVIGIEPIANSASYLFYH